jgi:hypothetical protein
VFHSALFFSFAEFEGETAMPALFDILIHEKNVVTVDVFEKATFSGMLVSANFCALRFSQVLWIFIFPI